MGVIPHKMGKCPLADKGAVAKSNAGLYKPDVLDNKAAAHEYGQ